MPILAAFAVPHPPLIIPAVGKGEERGIAATVAASQEVGQRIAELAPQTVVISSPHTTMYRDYNHISPGAGASGSFARFRAPQARYECGYDEELAGRTAELCGERGISAGTDYEREPQLDHGTTIPLHFIWGAWPAGVPRPHVVRVGLSGLSPAVHYQLGMALRDAATQLGRRVVFVASGDLSHKLLASGPYGFAPEGPEFDEKICRIFSSGDFLDFLTMDRGFADRAAECGLRSFQIMAGALDGTPVRPELLSHEGPFGVGYGVASFTPTGAEGSDDTRRYLRLYEEAHAADLAQRKAAEDPLVRLARASLETYVRESRRISPPAGLPSDLLATRAGCFVSLKIDGELRGCIGTILPTQASLAQEICANAISAGTRDPRFHRVRPEELPELVYDVDVLTAPEPIADESQLDVRRYGVIVSTDDGRRGLLLPDLDGIDTVDEQVSIAARKGHIDLADGDYHLERFQVVRHT